MNAAGWYAVEPDPAVEGFQGQGLVGIVGGDAAEFAGGEGGDLAGRQSEFELEALAREVPRLLVLRVERSWRILPIYGTEVI